MRDDLLLYYERELDYLRKSAAQFAEKYPKIASRLVLEPTKCEDPHVERLLEGICLSRGAGPPEDGRRISGDHRSAADGGLPAVGASDSFDVGGGIPARSGKRQAHQRDEDRARNSALFQAGGQRSLHLSHVLRHDPLAAHCHCRGVAPPSRLQPAVRRRLGWAIRLELRELGMSRSPRSSWIKLRFYLDGESGLVNSLYELLCGRLNRIVVRDPTPGSRLAPVVLPASALCAVGFGADEGMLPYLRPPSLGTGS